MPVVRRHILDLGSGDDGEVVGKSRTVATATATQPGRRMPRIEVTAGPCPHGPRPRRVACRVAVLVVIACIGRLLGAASLSGQHVEGDPAVSQGESRSTGASWKRLHVTLRVGASWATAPIAEGLEGGRGDLYDGSVGVHLGRHVGIELGASLWEYGVTSSELGKVGEWSAYTFIPSFRLRYPLDRDRLVPYVVAGVGFGYSELNDKTSDAVSGNAKPSVAYSLGGGLGYFIAPNLSIGVDVKHQWMSREIAVLGEIASGRTRSLMVSAGIQAEFPEKPAAGFAGVRWREPQPYGLRPYLSLRWGGRFYLDDGFGEGAMKSGRQTEQINSGSIGLGINRFVAFEIAVETHDLPVHSTEGDVKLAEYGTWNFLPTIMGRYPVLEGKLVPYASLGFGFSKSDINDRTLENGNGYPRVDGGGWGSMWGAAVGGDFFFAGNLALILESKYVGQTSPVLVDGADASVDMSSVLVSGGFRIYLR